MTLADRILARLTEAETHERDVSLLSQNFTISHAILMSSNVRQLKP